MQPKADTNTRREPKQARSKRLVNWILHAATQVFEERGYANCTTNHIAERAGVSIGSLYQYFPNKEAIFAELARQHLREGERLVFRLFAAAQENPCSLHDLLHGFFTGLVELHVNNPHLHRLFREEASLPKDIIVTYQDFQARLIQEIASLLHSHPEVKVHKTELATFMLVHTVDNLAHQIVIHPPGGVSRAACIDEAVMLCMRYLAGTINAV